MEINKNKKNIVIPILFGVVVISLLCLIYSLVVRIKNIQIKDNDIVATSKYGNVTVKDFKEYLNALQTSFNQSFDFNKLSNEEKELIAKEIINERIILEKTKKENIISSKEYKEKIVLLENNLSKEIFLKKLLDKEITEKEIEEKYEEAKKELSNKKELKVKHILVKTEEEIKNVVKELGTLSFEDAAQKYSLDVSKDNGGDLGYIIDDQVVPEFADALAKTAFNKISSPFKTKFGWHVLIKEKQRKARIPEYEESKNIIKNNLIKDFLRNYREENLKNSEVKFVK